MLAAPPKVLTAQAARGQAADMVISKLPVTASLVLLGVLSGADQPKAILSETFTDPAAAAKTWRGPGAADDGGWRIALPAAGTAKVSASIPAAEIAGRKVRLSVRMRNEDVSTRPKAWNGVKALLALVSADGEKTYPQLPTVDGTRPWTTVEKTFAVPANVVKADVVLGLENVSGSVWFDDVRVELVAE